MTSASSESPQLGPVQSQERVILLDVLRAVAILGMFYMNYGDVRFFASTFVTYGPGFQSGVHTALRVLASGKFQALFGLLMGVGMAVQVGRADHKGVDIVRVYFRRLLFLFLFGFIGDLFLPVDILRKLAVTGGVSFLIAYSLRKHPRLLLLIIVWMFLSTAIAPALESLDDSPRSVPTTERIEERTARAWQIYESRRAQVATVRSPVYPVYRIKRSLVREFTRVPYDVQTMEAVFSRSEWLLPFMLLGFFLWQIGVLRRSWEHRRFFWALLLIGGGTGLSFSWISTSLSHQSVLVLYGLSEPLSVSSSAVRTFCGPLSVVALDLAYISAIALLLLTKWAHRILQALAPAGRMAFTNYFLHILLAPVLFPLLFGWWLREPGPAQGVVKVTAVFALMVLFSTWWLKRFRFGPFEWLWRSLTYWKLQPMRVEGPVPVE